MEALWFVSKLTPPPKKGPLAMMNGEQREQWRESYIKTNNVVGQNTMIFCVKVCLAFALFCVLIISGVCHDAKRDHLNETCTKNYFLVTGMFCFLVILCVYLMYVLNGLKSKYDIAEEAFSSNLEREQIDTTDNYPQAFNNYRQDLIREFRAFCNKVGIQNYKVSQPFGTEQISLYYYVVDTDGIQRDFWLTV